MRFSLSSAVLASAALLPTGTVAQQTTSECSSVHIFLVKGNNEPYPGRQGALITAICTGLKGCDYEDVQWQNMLEDDYCGSVEQGAANGAAQIKAYNKKCPDTKLVLSGYSQGGQVIGDILGGGGGVFFQDCVQRPNPALERSSPAGKMIVAAMIFGDTRHTAGQSYNFLTGSSKDGLFPRPGDQLAGMNDYASVLRNWCVDTDPICAQGDVVETHLNYFDVYSGQVGEWVKEMVGKATVGGGSSSGSRTATASGTTSEIPDAAATSEVAELSTTEAVETTTEAVETTTEAVETTTEAVETTTEAKSTATATTEAPELTTTEETETSTARRSSSEDASTTAEATSSDGGHSGSNADETTSSGSAAETGDSNDGAGLLAHSFGLIVLGMVAVLGT